MNINLKSNLAKYVSLAELCAAGSEIIDEIEIVANDREDIDLLYQFMLEANK